MRDSSSFHPLEGKAEYDDDGARTGSWFEKVLGTFSLTTTARTQAASASFKCQSPVNDDEVFF